MSLILCRQEPVTVPLYIEDLGIHLYSSQELCYVIYNNPLLVLEGFIDKRLTEFLRSELRMPFLAERVEKWMDSHGATEEILYLILKECNYYTPKEQAAYRQTVNGLKKLSEEEYEKRRADYFYGLDLFGKAVTIYEQILDGAGRHLSGDFRGKVWNNIAACYAKLFCYQKAMHAYENAWNAKPELHQLLPYKNRGYPRPEPQLCRAGVCFRQQRHLRTGRHQDGEVRALRHRRLYGNRHGNGHGQQAGASL